MLVCVAVCFSVCLGVLCVSVRVSVSVCVSVHVSAFLCIFVCQDLSPVSLRHSTGHVKLISQGRGSRGARLTLVNLQCLSTLRLRVYQQLEISINVNK